MKRKLYSNMKRMTSFFSVAIVCVTLTTLLLRLTVFSDLAAMAAPEAAPTYSEEQTGLFDYTISSKVTFEAPGAKGDLLILNPDANECYMTVAIIKPDTGENLFYTGFIKPGQGREGATLHIQLPEGVYQCVAQVTAFDSETLESIGSEERDITLYIGQKAK